MTKDYSWRDNYEVTDVKDGKLGAYDVWIISINAISSEPAYAKSVIYVRKDVPIILDFIKELAEYEKMSDQVVVDEKLLREWIFEKKKAEVIFVLEDGKEVGFALFFHNFSTFLGRAGIYLEDLYVKEEFRGRGYGKLLLKTLARIAVERKCGRLEFSCLDWNKPSIDFYLSLGAKQMNGWTVYRFAGEELVNLSK